MPITKFMYIDGKSDTNKETVLTRVVDVTSVHYTLPDIVLLEFRKLGHSTYGETVLDLRNKNKIILNIGLGIRETVYVLTHELIHLSQITTGQLALGRNGSIIWDYGYKVDKNRLNNLTYKEYCELPWEADVVKKQQFLLEKLLNF